MPNQRLQLDSEHNRVRSHGYQDGEQSPQFGNKNLNSSKHQMGSKPSSPFESGAQMLHPELDQLMISSDSGVNNAPHISSDEQPSKRLQMDKPVNVRVEQSPDGDQIDSTRQV